MCVSVLDGNWGQDVDLEPLTRDSFIFALLLGLLYGR